MDPAEAVDVANPPDTGSSLRRSWKIAVALAIPVFALHLAFGLRLEALGAFDQQDLFFNADVAVQAFADWKEATKWVRNRT